MDVPLLYESGELIRLMHKVIVVRCEPEQQVERLLGRTKMTASQAELRVSAQMPLDKKAAMADYVVDNTGVQDHTQEQVQRIINDIRRSKFHWKLRFYFFMAVSVVSGLTFYLAPASDSSENYFDLPPSSSLLSMTETTLSTSRESGDAQPADVPLEKEKTLKSLGFYISKNFDWTHNPLSPKKPLETILRHHIDNFLNTDSYVYIGQSTYNCHRMVLQCYSIYFDSHPTLTEFTLPSNIVTEDAFEFFYKWATDADSDSIRRLTRDHVIQVLVAARHLKVHELAIQCFAVLNEEHFFSEDVAYVAYLMAQSHGLEDVKSIMIPRVRDFFLSLVSTKDFLELDFEAVTSLLSSSNIRVHNEMEVFMSAVRWIKYDWPKRCENVLGVMRCVRFGLISAKTLIILKRNTHSPEFVEILRADPQVVELIDDGIAYMVTQGNDGESENDRNCERLGIAPPQNRSWILPDKVYETYQDFLRELRNIRSILMISIAATTSNMSNEQCSGDAGRIRLLQGEEYELAQLGFEVAREFDWHGVTGIPNKSDLFENLRRRFYESVNPDCTININGLGQYETHRMLLNAYSNYFCSHSNGTVLELPVSKVTLKAFRSVYRWMVESSEEAHTVLKRQTILEVYTAAKYLEISELQNVCFTLINHKNFFQEGSAFVLYLMAKPLELTEIMELMIPRIGVFFLTLVCTQDFLELDVRDVCSLLTSNNIVVNSESDVLFSGIRWLKGNWKKNKRHVPAVMGCIRFGLIPTLLLCKIRSIEEMVDIVHHPDVSKMIDVGLAYSFIEMKHRSNKEQYFKTLSEHKITEPLPRVWTDDKRTNNSYEEFLWFLHEARLRMLRNCKKGKRHHRKGNADASWLEARSPIRVKCNQSNKIAETTNSPQGDGGDRDSKLNKPLSKDTVRTQELNVEMMFEEPLTAEVEQLRTISSIANSTKGCDNAMKVDQRPVVEGFHLPSSAHDSILLFGGVDPTLTVTSEITNTARTVIHYDSENNVWEFIGSMPHPRVHHVAVLCKERVYIVGGEDPSIRGISGEIGVTSAVFSLDTKSGVWNEEVDLPSPRKLHAGVEVNGRIIIIGGIDRHGKILDNIQKYNLRSRSWSQGPPLNVARYAHSVAYFDNSIWVVGGVTEKGETDSVERLFLLGSRWEEQPPIRFPRSYASLLVAEDALYLVGGLGRDPNGQILHSLQDVDVWTGSEWKLRFPMNTPRHSHTAAVIGCSLEVAPRHLCLPLYGLIPRLHLHQVDPNSAYPTLLFLPLEHKISTLLQFEFKNNDR